MIRRLGPTALAFTAFALAACNSESTSSGGASAPPAGVSCSSTTTVNDAASASAALAAAKPGACVALGGPVSGALDVPAGVALFGASASATTITSDVDAAAVTLHEGSTLARVSVTSAKRVGVAVRAANARMSEVVVTNAKVAALAVICKESETSGCAAGAIRLDGVELGASALGLWASGAHVVMKGGKSEGHTSTGLTGASGVIGVDGAKLELDGVSVSKNQGAGVLVDGASTTLSVKSGAISENGERGVWVQRVAGTLEAPAVRIEGTELVKNRIVGVGAVESRGIIIVGGRIASTVATPVATNLASTEDVGDGVGLFAGSTDLNLDGTHLDSNARAAAIVDGSERGIIIVGGKVTAGAAGIKVVVQGKGGAEVKVPEADRSKPAAALGVSAPKLMLPSVL
ncbi:MAG: right-handed parallel beta-helix repeat-containing protein [Deltaproteobacteria bacterium]|nr:right-handed parallel beta-helix repeat-containing protein [Deltaproteobacteria bacterium]